MKTITTFLSLLIALVLAGCSSGTDGKDGKDGVDATSDSTPVTITNPGGRAEKGPFRMDSEIYIYPYSAGWKQDGAAVKGYTESNDGSYQVYADLTAVFGRYEVYGESYNEVDGGYDSVGLRLMSRLDSPTKNLNPLTNVQDMIAFQNFHDPDSSCYQDGDACLSQAKTVILDYLNLPDTEMDFSEMSLQGTGLGDAVMALFSFYVAEGRTGPEQNEHMREIADSIMEGDLVLKQSIQDSISELQLNAIRDNLINKFAELGVNATAPPIEDLNAVSDYYGDIWNRDPVVLESKNLDQSSTCAIDVSTFNSFGYPITFSDIENAQYFASEISGNLSLWSVALCDNGVDTFSCPGTQILTIEELREILLPDPANLNYNGRFTGSTVSGQFFLVQNLDSPGAPWHSCAGTMTPFGRNIAATNNDWTNAIGYDNGTSWFRRGIKWATTN